jgi:hypothetical protein
VGKLANPEPTTRSHEEPASPLVAFVRLLARQMAHDAFATAQSASASEPNQIEPEDTCEAED